MKISHSVRRLYSIGMVVWSAAALGVSFYFDDWIVFLVWWLIVIFIFFVSFVLELFHVSISGSPIPEQERKVQKKYLPLFLDLAALAALSVWGAVIGIIFVHNEWSWSIKAILPTSVATIVTTSLLCRFWISRKKLASYGTLLGVPFSFSLLVCWGQYFYYNGWSIFTAHYWNDKYKGGLDERLFDMGLIGAICILPAISVVAYYQRRGKRREQHAA